MTVQVPTFVRVEYRLADGTWTVGHAGINLLNPGKYVTDVMARGKIARAIDVDSGAVYLPEGYEEVSPMGSKKDEKNKKNKKGKKDKKDKKDKRKVEESSQHESVDDLIGQFAEANEQRAQYLAEQQKNSLFLGMPDTADYIFDGHAGAGPSGAERWMNCTMSLTESRRFLETLTPNQQREFAKASLAAREGTTAHAAAEVEALVALGRMTSDEAEVAKMDLALSPEEEGEAYDEEMGEYISEYVDLVNQYAVERGSDSVLIEQRVEAVVPLTGVHENDCHVVAGSGDFIALPTKDDPNIAVGDLKYGQGIDVEVEANPQVRIYALGALDLLTDDEGNLITPVETVTYYIVQPRLGGIKPWTESVDDLLTWRDEVLAPALTKALFGADEGATYEPSEKACHFCPVRGSCAALIESRVEAGRDLFETISEVEAAEGSGASIPTGSLSDERLAELLTQVLALVDIKDDLKAEAQRRAHRGVKLPGFKLVSYTPRRTWTDEAAEALDPLHPDDWQEDLWMRKLMTPTQALAILNQSGKNGEEMIGHLIDVPPKRPVIAPEGDRRKEWEGRAPEDMFDNEEEKTNE